MLVTQTLRLTSGEDISTSQKLCIPFTKLDLMVPGMSPQRHARLLSSAHAPKY